MDYLDCINSIIEKAKYREKEKKRGAEYVFLIGAGASVSSHIPDGQTMCNNLQDKYKIDKEMIKKLNVKGDTNYQVILGAIRSITNESFISETIRELIKKARRSEPDGRWIINNCYNILAGILTEKIHFSRTVFTTNFDPLLYYAFIQNWNIEPILIRHYKELETMRPKDVEEEFPCLIYLHGYWQNHQLYHEPEQFNEYGSEWVNRLLLSWVGHDVIVIGYSGLEDNIALKWLKECLEKGQTVWWCIYCPDGVLRDDQTNPIREKLNVLGKRLKFIPIKSADQFSLDLGKAIGITHAIEISCVNNIFEWFKPNSISHFSNGAELNYTTDKELILDFKLGDDKFPGNNHAGLNIDTVEYEVNIDDFMSIEIDYAVNAKHIAKGSPGFEFKLHSKENAWSYHVPICKGKNTLEIPLDKFRDNKVNLNQIWRIVIAADVKCFGRKGEATVSISKTRLNK
jgi:hypothetical protein